MNDVAIRYNCTSLHTNIYRIVLGSTEVYVGKRVRGKGRVRKGGREGKRRGKEREREKEREKEREREREKERCTYSKPLSRKCCPMREMTSLSYEVIFFGCFLLCCEAVEVLLSSSSSSSSSRPLVRGSTAPLLMLCTTPLLWIESGCCMLLKLKEELEDEGSERVEMRCEVTPTSDV